MKQIEGWWLPDADTHFEGHLHAGPRIEGRATYQWRKIEAALAQISSSRRSVALDIGAHVGFWSVFLAESFNQVRAFEPSHVAFHCLLRNIEGIENIEPNCQAVSDKESVLALHTVDANSGNTRISEHNHGNELCMAVTIDSLGLTACDFIKIDVEGWESHVVVGGIETIRRFKPVIVVEQKPGHGGRYGVSDTAAADMLQSMGAKLLWLKAGDYCFGW